MNPDVKEEIIKNPARSREADFQQDDFLPEYIRKGLTPIPALDEPAVSSFTPISSAFPKPNAPKVTNVPEIGEFILMVNDKLICHGSQDYILSEAKSILYGENIKFRDQQVGLNDIVVLKRIGLKVGVFVDD